MYHVLQAIVTWSTFEMNRNIGDEYRLALSELAAAIVKVLKFH